MKAIRVYEHGPPNVMSLHDVDMQEPGAGQIRVRQSAIGVNFVDTSYRSGAFKVAALPFTPGKEGAGVVTAIGEDVTGLAVGDRVAYGSAEGCYAEEPVIAAAAALRLPPDIEFETAAGMMLKGLTCEYLLHRVYKVAAGDTILLHAAAGGVGLIATQWAKALGARVIGTVGTEEKAALALEYGCDHVILYRHEDVAARVREITDGEGVQVVYDSVGQATLAGSLDSLAPAGKLVSFGAASGPITGFEIGSLIGKGSLSIARTSLASFSGRRKILEDMAAQLFSVVQEGLVKIPICSKRPLGEAAKAHEAIADRATTGVSILLP